ncbi:heterokaryon incompatibility protein-domain-containing protein [Halenospora varia]|nr:heterokaryon incompatibility protein-domain-containing protein [Halenospora varia]
MACELCNKILEVFRIPFGDEVTTPLGPHHQILKYTCQQCHHIRERVYVACCDWLNELGSRKIYPQSLSITLSIPRGQRDLDFSMSYSHGSTGLTVELVRGASTPWGSGKLVDKQWIDPGIFRTWKSACDRLHKSCQALPDFQYGSLAPARPRWLIDVSNFCLVPASTLFELRYVALSYVWGGTMTLQTLLSTVDKFQTRDAFGVGDYANQIPATIRDAMHVTSLLGERFLWVDSLCIVQDDEATKTDCLNNMTSIYAYATVTIIAAQGNDADEGLRGVKGDVSKRRQHPQEIFTVGGEKMIKRYFPPATSAWYSRGWTYQEGVFASRRVVFEGESARWQCNEALWSEEIYPEKHAGPKPFDDEHQHHLFTAPFPNMDAYREMIWRFTQRRLTFAEDSIFALAGVTNVLSQTFEGGFLCGLPELFFDSALLWQGKVERKTMKFTSRGIPSWSWSGWSGVVRGDLWTARNYVKSSANPAFGARDSVSYPGYQLYPILQWYSSDNISTEERRPIANRAYAYRELSFDPEKTLPHGWTRHILEREKPLDDETITLLIPGQGKYYFTHICDPLTHFWFPIPICESSAEAKIPPHHSYICCKTQMAFISTYTRRISQGGTPYIVLQTESGSFIGALHLDEEASINRGVYSLISTSRCVRLNRCPIGPPGWDDKDRPRATTLYEYYYVLWVDWDSEHSYWCRKGLGHVIRDVWEQMDLNWVDITLG